MWFLRKKKFDFEAVGLTDIGMVRNNNEDNFLILGKKEPNAFDAASWGLYIIADGMGGHQAGEVASEMAVKTISASFQEKLQPEAGPVSATQIIEEAIQKANAEIFKTASDKPELNSMGTTVTLGFRLDNELYIGHVGDSRAYLVRKGKMRQLTEDHSLVAQLIKEKVITPEEARTHPDRSKILRCLGVSGETRIDSFNPEGNEHKLNIQYGDVLMFCSDGLCGYAPDDEILSCLNKKEDAKTLCQSLVNLANLKGGGDNISVIVVKTGTSAS